MDLGGTPRHERRSDDGGSGFTRRRFLTGSLLFAAGGGLVYESNAFEQVAADRSATFAVADDEGALVGLDIAEFVDAGEDGQELVTVTNNTEMDLTVSVSLVDRSNGDVTTGETDIAPGGDEPFTVDVSGDAPGGVDALSFEVTATDESTFDATATRSTTVRKVLWQFTDQSDNRARYTVYYEVVGVAESTFDQVRVTFENTTDSKGTGTETNDLQEGSVYFETQNGGTGDNDYEITIEVIDGTGSTILSDSMGDTANGSGGGGDDLGDEDDPTIERFGLLADNSQNNKAQFEARYEVSVPDESKFEEVRVEFDHVSTNKQQNDLIVTSTSTPTGDVTYPERGGVGKNDDEFSIEATVYKPSSDPEGEPIPVDSMEFPSDEFANGTIDGDNGW